MANVGNVTGVYHLSLDFTVRQSLRPLGDAHVGDLGEVERDEINLTLGIPLNLCPELLQRGNGSIGVSDFLFGPMHPNSVASPTVTISIKPNNDFMVVLPCN